MKSYLDSWTRLILDKQAGRWQHCTAGGTLRQMPLLSEERESSVPGGVELGHDGSGLCLSGLVAP